MDPRPKPVEIGIPAECVAERCRAFSEPTDRELFWYLQWASWQKGGLNSLARKIIQVFPDRLGTPSMARFGTDPNQVYDERQTRIVQAEVEPWKLGLEWFYDDDQPHSETLACGKRVRASEFVKLATERALRCLAKDLEDYCLGASRYPAVGDAPLRVDYFRGLREAVLDYMQRSAREQATRLAATSVSEAILVRLEQVDRRGVSALAWGRPRTGKSFTAKSWCFQRPGRARYVEVPANGGEPSLLHEIAEAIGIGGASRLRIGELRRRLSSVLCSGDLIIVLDEAQHIWPTMKGRPGRVLWILKEINAGTRFALIGLDDFFDGIERTAAGGWAVQQFHGRFRSKCELPEQLTRGDLIEVARVMFPGLTDQDRLPAIYVAEQAHKSLGHIAPPLSVLEDVAVAALDRARANAREAASAGDVAAALADEVLPSLASVAKASGIDQAGARRPPKQARDNSVANRLQGGCEVAVLGRMAGPSSVAVDAALEAAT